MTKRIEFKTANSIGHFEIPDGAEISVPRGIQTNEGVENMPLNSEVETKADTTEAELAKYEDDNLLLLPTEMALRSERKIEEETSNDNEVAPMLPPNM